MSEVNIVVTADTTSAVASLNSLRASMQGNGCLWKEDVGCGKFTAKYRNTYYID